MHLAVMQAAVAATALADLAAVVVVAIVVLAVVGTLVVVVVPTIPMAAAAADRSIQAPIKLIHLACAQAMVLLLFQQAALLQEEEALCPAPGAEQFLLPIPVPHRALLFPPVLTPLPLMSGVPKAALATHL